jgi:catechol-2,3-dioxygenase
MPAKKTSLTIRSLHHIAIKAADLERAERFYGELLGLSQLEYQYDAQGNRRSVWYNCEGVILMIEKLPRDTEHTQDKKLPLIAFQIDPKMAESWKKKLSAAKIEITHRSDYTLYFHDHDGNLLALTHFPKPPVKSQ